MYELIQLSPRCYYVESPAKIGLVRLDGENVCLIDSGSDKDAGKKVLRHIEANGWKLTAIYNTHSHADHVGGNRFLQERTGCRVYAPAIERDFTEHTVLESAFLYGGFPPKDLRHKFLYAQESAAEPLTDAVMPEGLSILPLPGHSFSMVGFFAPDGVCYIGDAVSSRETLEKYRVGFLYDVGAHLQTLEALKSVEATCFVPSHAPATEDVKSLLDCNIDAVRETAERITAICRTPQCFEDVLARLFTDYGLDMSFQQYALVGSTVRSYLSYLKTEGRVDVRIRDGYLLWESTENA